MYFTGTNICVIYNYMSTVTFLAFSDLAPVGLYIKCSLTVRIGRYSGKKKLQSSPLRVRTVEA